MGGEFAVHSSGQKNVPGASENAVSIGIFPVPQGHAVEGVEKKPVSSIISGLAIRLPIGVRVFISCEESPAVALSFIEFLKFGTVAVFFPGPPAYPWFKIKGRIFVKLIVNSTADRYILVLPPPVTRGEYPQLTDFIRGCRVVILPVLRPPLGSSIVDYIRQWSENLSLKFGAKIRNLKRSRRAHHREWHLEPGFAEDEKPTMADFTPLADGDNRVPAFRYVRETGPMLDINGEVNDFFLASFAEDPDRWRPLSNNQFTKSTTYNYEIDETIIAAYAMGTAHIGENLTVLAGLRFENTETDATWVASAVIPPLPDLPFLDDISSTKSYSSLFPSLVATWRLGANQQHVIRAAVSTTISRPEYEEIVPHDRSIIYTVWPDDTANFDDGEEEAFLGNPELTEQNSTNYDLGWEWYYGKGDSLSVNLFYKDTKDFLSESSYEKEIEGPIDPENPDEEPDTVIRRSTFTTNSATQIIQGVEVFWTQSLEFLPSPLDGFGFVFNYTYIDGEQSRPNYLEEDLAQGIFTLDPDDPFLEGSTLVNQPKRIYNFQLYWEKWKFSARLAYNYVGSFIRDTTDVDYVTINSLRETTDLAFNYRLSKRLSFFLDIKNIGEAPDIRTFRVFPNFPDSYGNDEVRWVFGIRGKL